MNGYALVMEKYPQWFDARKPESHLNWNNDPTESKALGKRKHKDELTDFLRYFNKIPIQFTRWGSGLYFLKNNVDFHE